ncbi:MAG: hypothetical protein LBU09_05620 [Endomicrobium sp.]|jgi:hypothetical protein|nr:hypothetical protein [Endomicrobium sp.]
MKKLFFIPLFLLLVFSASSCKKKADTSMFKEGDIIFQNKKSKETDLLSFISKAQYNSAGVVFKIKGKVYVLETAQPVQLTPIQIWIEDGQDGSYELKRLTGYKELMTPENIEKLNDVRKDFMGKPQDIHFDWDDKSLYGGELVWKMFKNVFNINLCELQALADFDLSNPQIRERIEKTYGKKVPLYEDLVTLAGIYGSPFLETVDKKTIKN